MLARQESDRMKLILIILVVAVVAFLAYRFLLAGRTRR